MGRFAAVAVILVLFAAGCGNDTVDVNPAPEATEAPAGSTAPEIETTTTEAPVAELSPKELLLAAIDSTTGRAVRGQARLEGEMLEGQGLVFDLQVDAEGDIEAILLSDGEQLTTRTVDGQTYVGYPGELAALAFPNFSGETAWLTVGPEHAEQFTATCPSLLANLGTVSAGCDPAADLRALADAAGEATVVGEEELRGVSTTHLRFFVSLANLPSTGQGDLSTDLGGAFDVSLPLEVWIDDDRLLRRLVVDLSSVFGGFAELFGDEQDAAAELPGWRTVLEYHDFDESISVDAPAAESLVGDLADIEGLAG